MMRTESGITSFGPFRLSAATRELEKDGIPLPLGHRALDILIVLVEHAGEVVSNRELISRAWRGLVVNASNIRVHMTALRRALGDGENGVRYIANITSQGYCFVAPVVRVASTAPLEAQRHPSTTDILNTLPAALARMVGRDDTIRTITTDLCADRFVTIVGPGGMGKTTVAISVGHALLEEFAGNVCFIDIGAVTDPALLAGTVASTLGLGVQTGDVLPVLMAFLRATRMLLVLDNCEHLIDAAASLAELIFTQAHQVHLLATSREALRVEGEHAHWLRPLESPTPSSTLSAAKALSFPAVQLFVERAVASDSHFTLNDANAPIVAEICGRLDGIALALELVAGRVSTYGLEGTENLLNKRLGLHWRGRRTALPRHQTLHALLDWSYSLLTQTEQSVLRQLSILVGTFSLEAAQAVASDGQHDEAHILHVLEQLVAKSLLSAVKTGEVGTSYRLLGTTRAFAMRKLEESGEDDLAAKRHARYFMLLLSSSTGLLAEAGVSTPSPARREHLGNLRAALEWSFNDRADAGHPHQAVLGINLAAAAAKAFMEFSLLDECRMWSTAALTLLDDSTRGDKRELVLQEARAISSMWSQGNSEDVRAAILRGLEIAQSLGETAHRMRLLTALHAYLIRIADMHGALAVAEEMETMARLTKDASCIVMSDWLRGSSQHFLGDQAAAKRLIESGFARSNAGSTSQFGLDNRVRALVTFARVLWLNGYPDRAERTARQALDQAFRSDKPLNVCFSLLYTCPVFLWRGDLDAAQDVIERLMAHTHWQGLSAFHAEGRALQGELLIRRGRIEDGIDLLRSALSEMTANRQTLLVTFAACWLAEGLMKIRRHDEALAIVDAAVTAAPGGEDALELPELLRIRANIISSMPGHDEAECSNTILRALAIARRQGALGWELRTTMLLARSWSATDRRLEGRAILSSLYERFTEGFETIDLKSAEQLLQDIDCPHTYHAAELQGAARDID